MKKAVIVLFLLANSWRVGASDSVTTIAVYKIRSKVLSAPFTDVLTDHIESILLGYRFFRVISRSNLDVIITEDHLVQSGVMAEGGATRENGSISTVEKVSTGSVGWVGKGYSFTLKIIDVRSGRVDAAVQRIHNGPAEDLLDVADGLIKELCRRSGYLRPDLPAAVVQDTVSRCERKNPSSERTRTNEKSEKEVKKTEKTVSQSPVDPSVSGGTARPAGVKREKAVNDRTPSRLGKLISIGSAIIFATLAALIFVNRK